MGKRAAKKSLLDAYQFERFKTSSVAKGKLGDKNARVLSLSRRSKKASVTNVASCTEAIMIVRSNSFVIFRAVTAAFTLSLRFAGFSVSRPV